MNDIIKAVINANRTTAVNALVWDKVNTLHPEIHAAITDVVDGSESTDYYGSYINVLAYAHPELCRDLVNNAVADIEAVLAQ